MAKVTLVVPVFPKLSETFIVNKFLGLADLGHDVSVMAQRRDLLAWAQFRQLASRRDLSARVQELHSFTLGPPESVASRVRNLVRNAVRLIRCGVAESKYVGWKTCLTSIRNVSLITMSPRIIHFEFGSLAVGRAWFYKAMGCKVVVSFRGYDLNFVGLDAPGYYDPIWRHADAVHCLGQDLWKRALRRGCSETMTHALIPPAIDADFFSRRTPPGPGAAGSALRPLRILSVGRLEWKKGYEYALAAVKLLRDRGLEVDYRIVGTGEYLEAVAFCRHQLNLESCVTLIGAATQSQVRDEMENADVLLHAAVSEGFCNAVLEAQAMELPVVTSDADGLAENVEHGVTGFVTPRRDASALAGSLQRIAIDGDLRVRMGKAGRSRVCASFRLSRQMESFSRLYERVLSMEKAL